MTSRPSAQEWADRLGLKRRGGEYIGACPSCGGTDRFHVKDGRLPGVVDCRQCDTPYADHLAQVFPDNRLGAPLRDFRRIVRRGSWNPRAGPKTGRKSAPDAAARIAAARALWAGSTQIPGDPQHPARRWMQARNLWRPECPVPPMLRWIGAGAPDALAGVSKILRGGTLEGPRGALWTVSRRPAKGCVVALVAPPARWAAAWPELPEPQALQLQAVTLAGLNPWPGKGLDKRPFGFTGGGCVLIGEPDGGDVQVAEGLADALARAARAPSPAVAALGTSGLASDALVDYLAERAEGGAKVAYHADRDDNRAGETYARRAVRDVRRRLPASRWGNVRAVLPPDGHKDEAAAAQPFETPSDGWQVYAEGLGLPEWEAIRQTLAVWD